MALTLESSRQADGQTDSVVRRIPLFDESQR